MSKLRFYLSLSADEYLRYYQGAARVVVVRSTDNRLVQFPAEHLRSFVTHDGISGFFEIEFDDNHKFIGLRRL